MQRFLVLLLSLAVPFSYASRIKDITSLAGVRENQLVGYGLVVGLDGTGDKTAQAPFTNQSFRNMLVDMGIRIPDKKNFQLKNVAAVAISANFPPFARVGQKIDITISSIGNAKSLRGGSLIMSPLKGADGRVYAMAQGNVVVSGFGAKGADGSKVTVNITASGRVPNGATIEAEIPTPYLKKEMIVFELHQPDFTTSQRIADTINKELGFTVAHPIDAGAVAVRIRQHKTKNSFLKQNPYVNFISGIENLHVEPAAAPAKIIVNSRSGTIVVGRDVRISPVAVAHGNLSVSVSETPFVSQPNPFAGGETVAGRDSNVDIQQEKNRAFVFQPGASLKEMVDAINRVGAAPGDLISILEAIDRAGALHAELEII